MVKRNENENFNKIYKVLLPKDYLRFYLTGEFFSDLSDASGTYWLDVGKRDWSTKLLEASSMNISQMPNNVYKMSQHFEGLGFKNILEPSKSYFCHNGNFYPGCTFIDCTTCAKNKGSPIMIVTTCIEGTCTNAEKLVSEINFN